MRIWKAEGEEADLELAEILQENLVKRAKLEKAPSTKEELVDTILQLEKEKRKKYEDFQRASQTRNHKKMEEAIQRLKEKTETDQRVQLQQLQSRCPMENARSQK
eukprot:TRINITY_DN1116_c0_g1_i5.p3 TRINITY_DN1116_c0_g1~~TRINITY_DN1116_c0_g1_i5.p3  ORF type:complete len:105 (-),score=22.29 TRINITY_DN1116_c0_g1_i5:341-655(-)